MTTGKTTAKIGTRKQPARGFVRGDAALNGRRVLGIDLETYCELDLSEVGVWEYTQHPSFEILICCYSLDGGKVREIDLAQGEELPPKFVAALNDDYYIKSAFNANFELLCLSVYLGEDLDPAGWLDTMILAAMVGLPTSLDGLGKAVNGQGEQKDSKGKALIRYFSMPCKPTKVNGGRTRNLPEHDPEKWALYVAYCAQDVRTEGSARDWIIKRFGVDWGEHYHWCIDYRINYRGILVNRPYVQHILDFYEDFKARVLADMKSLTGINNPNSRQQLLDWLDAQGFPLPDTTGDTIEEYRHKAERDGFPLVAKILSYKQFISKSSISKYKKMLSFTEYGDGRAHFTFQFYGASRTGRYAGRGIQLQNLPRMHLSEDELALYVKTITAGDMDFFEVLAADPIDMIKQLTRASFIAPEGKQLFVSDLNSIEARVLGWLAGVEWRMNVFKTTGKIYETSASQAFGVPVEEITKDNPLRQQGKVMELALGYGGGKGALATMDFNGEVRPDLSPEAIAAYREENPKRANGMDDEDVKTQMIEANYDRLKVLWRDASPEIPDFWKALEKAAVACIKTGRQQRANKYITFSFRHGWLFAKLPSGRELAYPQAWTKKKTVEPKEGDTFKPFETDVIFFKSMKGIFWGSEQTYGGKLCENIVQAIARDIIVDAIAAIENDPEKRFAVVGHVHDEVITEGSLYDQLDDLDAFLKQPVVWADSDLVLGAAGFTSPYYMKD